MSGIITSLRDMVPIRALTHVEAFALAERQATEFLKLAAVVDPGMLEGAIISLPRMQVERIALGGTSGATQWSHGRWLILLNADEHFTRQRFSLAHEFKHVLDHKFVDVIYEPIRGMSAAERRERVCDHFAACLLMPRTLLKRVYCNDGIQDVRQLALHFGVSPQAMRYRLNLLGLTEPTIRCQVAA